jgi:CBS domain-containing protein
MKQEIVKTWMSKDVITITPDTSLPEAYKLMTEHRIRRLPVVKGGRVVGITTLGDVKEAKPSDATTLSIWEANYLLEKVRIKSIMTKNPVTVKPDSTIGKTAKIMLDQKVSGLPVVDDADQVIGIITESDIFRLVVQKWV